ncbi:MAG: hypothetical protein NTW95_08965 [Candidatus Aminicenantes bacterium]|nr:hypothetical protein [Candidatus Aminicenantes bacterium]
MKTRKSCFSIHILVIASALLAFAAGQEQQKEYVQVVNVELILRVLKDGAPVAGLKKSDFTLYEDGERCEINGFFENHRRIAHAGEQKKQLQQPRLYLLFFWVGNPAADVAGVLDEFFTSVYREGDRVILSTPLKTLELPSPEAIAVTRAAFLEQWRQEAKDSLSFRLQFHGELNRLLEELVRRLVEEIAKTSETSAFSEQEDTSLEKEINAFSAQYAMVVQEYQIRELSPDMTAFEAMARSLIPSKNDKFALVFFQHDTQPLFDVANVRGFCMTKKIPEGIASKLADALAKIEGQAKNAFNIRMVSEQLKSLFIQANIQFHLLFLSPYRNEGHGDASSFFALTKSEEIYSKWDLVMQEISKNSGGLRLNGDNMIDALDQAISFEDVYYHMTYIPRAEGGGKRQIDIRVNQPGMQVIYGRTLEMKELPLVKIAAISATSQLIRLEINDFYPIAREGIPTGFVHVDVNGRQADNEPLRLLLFQGCETDGTMELPIAFPQPGSWDLEVRVIDQVTGRQDVKKAKVEIAAAMPAPVPGKGPDPVLTALLARAAAYAENLKGAAFHFICRENVSEALFYPNPIDTRMPAVPRTDWVYDYQIVGRNGKIEENRVLLEKNREKFRQPNAQLETMFHSYFSFYMPVTMLAREKQRLYQYRLLGKEKVNDKNAWHIAAVCRKPGAIPWGDIWIGEEDGTVLKIRVDQTSIVGFEKLAQRAVERGLLPAITTVHEYDLEKHGIRFPSKTTFIEQYNSNSAVVVRPLPTAGTENTVREPSSFERSRTSFEYRDHQFFSVSTKAVEKPE